MDWQTTPYALLLFLTSLTTLALGLYGVVSVDEENRTPTVLAFVAVCVSASVWAGAYGVQLAAPTLDAKLAAYGVLHVGSTLVGPAWLAFAVSYAGRSDLLTRVSVAAMVAIPTALLVAFLTNPASLVLTDVSLVTRGTTALLETEKGPLYQLNLAYTYLIMTAGVALILSESLRSGRRVRRQAGLMVAGVIVPLAMYVLHILSVGPFGAVGEVNLTPVSLGVSTVLFGVALFRYRLLDLTPIASRVVLSQIGDGVVVLDRSGSITDVNSATERLFGERERLLGTPLSEHVPEYGGLDGLDADESVLVTVETDERGTEAHLQLTRSPLDRGGTRYGWVVLLRDVTELERQRLELERKNERLDSFASVVSHDLRNPLSVIDGYAELAQDTGDPEHLTVIRDTVSRMNDFLEDLLQLSQHGDTVTDLRTVSLAAVVGDAAESIEDPDLTVSIVGDARLTADRARLRQALDNLFRNARNHVDGPVSVTVGPLPDGFYVEDDGPGIPETDREQVFDVGFTTREEGTGLGLSIVRDIFEAHGWSIAVTGGSTGGARFEVTGVEVERDGEAETDTEAEAGIEAETGE
ncbi:histidine kinase N-terminal 7TM domain-containing protein [Halorubrum sp. AS12]|uniref:histidine kinase N-terminal 7TM domain-containing protein n=1 Tax=Halorubrum sp. AS12 TaxID=3409687 RepID=UPI003DA6DB80